MKLWDKLYESFTSEELKEVETSEYDIQHPSTNQFILTKPTGEKYTVKKQSSGNVTCDCPGFKYNKTCKHVNIVREQFPDEFKPRPRFPMSDMPLDLVHSVLDKYDPNWTLLGSGRRGKDTFKDIDILIDVPVDKFKELAAELDKNPEFEKVVAGDDIFRGYLKGFELDINRVNDDKQDKGAMLLYRTGPADLNTFMRQIAMGIGGSLSEKGLVDHVTNEYIIPKGASEEDYFKVLGLPYLEPNQREHWKDFIDEEAEIAKAREKQDKIVQSEKWIWDLAKDYQAAMEAGEFSDTDNYKRKYAKKYAVSPTSREMNYAYNIALKRVGGSYKHSPKSKQGKEDRANGLYASDAIGTGNSILEALDRLNEDEHPSESCGRDCPICSKNPELFWAEGNGYRPEGWAYISDFCGFHAKCKGLGEKILAAAEVQSKEQAESAFLRSCGEGRSQMVVFSDKETQTICASCYSSNFYADEEWCCDQLKDMRQVIIKAGECIYDEYYGETKDLVNATGKDKDYYVGVAESLGLDFDDECLIVKAPVSNTEVLLDYEVYVEGNDVT